MKMFEIFLGLRNVFVLRLLQLYIVDKIGLTIFKLKHPSDSYSLGLEFRSYRSVTNRARSSAKETVQKCTYREMCMATFVNNQLDIYIQCNNKN